MTVNSQELESLARELTPPLPTPEARTSGHFVQFYEGEEFLMDSVARFIGAGLGSGEAAIVVAEPDHQETLVRLLKDQGVDVAAVRARRQLILMDAQAALGKFMVAGMPDERLFNESMGAVVSWSLNSGRRLRAFGEMVALLWREGNSRAAIRLEELWNRLGQSHDFTLFCAYPLSGFRNTEDRIEFARICAEHTHVFPGESFTHPKRTAEERLRAVAMLQQKAESLDSELASRALAVDSGRHLAAIVESSDDAIISKNLDGVITSWNTSAQRIFGYRAEEVIGRPVTILIPQDRQDEEPGILERIRRGEHIAHYETVRIRKDGTLVEISVTVSPVRNADGVIVGASKIARDITQRRRDELALKLAKEQLARVNAELERHVEIRTASLREAVSQMEEFSYTVSHDLRAPLRGMQTYARALLEDYGSRLDEEGQRYLHRISKNAVRLDRMILDVLTFSRVARAEIRQDRVSLRKLINDIVQNYPGLQSPYAEITMGPLDDVQGHESSLTQALSNLLTNAVKFVAPGVTPAIRLRTERREGQVRLWIEDNGIGIDPRYQARLFNMFERIHPNLDYEGTGVGLAIVRKSMERMGGQVGVESDGKTGSRFWIQLPEPKPKPEAA